MSRYSLYGSEASLFTGKVRGYLRWKNIDFEEQAVTAEIMQSLIMPKVGWPVIPVLKTPDNRIIQDTADIIDEIEQVIPEPSVMPSGAIQKFSSLLMQVYGDQWLTLPAMHYRWNYNEEWIYLEFGRSSAPDASPEEQYKLGKERGQRFRSMVPLLGINERTIPGIEKSYEGFLHDFSRHLDEYPYVMGGRPSFADFCLLGPLYAHLYRDPASGEIMEKIAPSVARWTERVIAGQQDEGALVEDDIIPKTLLPIFERHWREHMPVLKATNQLLAEWIASAEEGEELPRAFGSVPFSVEGCDGETVARSFSLFRLQTALDALAAMNPADRKCADDFLKVTGAESLIDFQIAGRLERRDYKLMLAL